MGSSEMENSGKEKDPKTVPLSSPAPVPAPSQEPSSAVSAGGMAPDWSGFQAYSPMPPHGYVASSPQPHHPYMWGVQHMMPPYGTPPPPYVTMYPPGGMYAHPSMPQGSYPYSPYGLPSPNGIAEASGNTGSSIEGDGKQSEVKDKLPIKRSKGSLGSLNMIIGKNNEAGASANGACSKSAESASGGSSDGSDANSENDSGGSRHNGKDGEAASESGGSAHGQSRNGSNLPVNQSLAMVPMTATGVPSPPTNLNIGRDYWSGHGNVSTTVDGSQPQTWLQVSDERELKRQKRKQSNRESARRSRLRKQAECDELAQRADVLSGENATLRAELNRVKSEYEELLARNTSIKLQLASFPSLGGESLDKNEDEPESSSRQGVAETTRGPYNNSA